MEQKIEALVQLGKSILRNDPILQAAYERAERENGWFTLEFSKLALENIANFFLEEEKLREWIRSYSINPLNTRKVGIVMAGNIPAVGFFDWLCVFMSGHQAVVKMSSKDNILIEALIKKLESFYNENSNTTFTERLNGCDAYIATGSNNSSRYFEYYFGRYPSIIRRNKSSAALLTGKESTSELDELSKDVFLYFGLGCRSVSQIWVPEGYDFLPLLNSFRKFNYLAEHAKFKNNYDYQLSLLLLNKKYFMSTEAILLVENESLFAPVSQLHFQYYTHEAETISQLHNHPDIQCVCGNNLIPFGQSQKPTLNQYADGIDVMAWLSTL
jgi:hypothetical protein